MSALTGTRFRPAPWTIADCEKWNEFLLSDFGQRVMIKLESFRPLEGDKRLASAEAHLACIAGSDAMLRALIGLAGAEAADPGLLADPETVTAAYPSLDTDAGWPESLALHKTH